jgi:hypothetical protein
MTPTNLTEIFQYWQAVWIKIPLECCTQLTDSYPTRLTKIIQVKGGETKYLPLLKSTVFKLLTYHFWDIIYKIVNKNVLLNNIL